MANAYQLAVLRAGVEAWNKRRMKDPYERIDLREANLREADLSWANLSEANLCEANLNRAKLFLANLSEADLRKAELRRAKLNWANLSEAKLSGADLRGAELIWVDLSRADLSRANLCGAYLIRADLSYAKLFSATMVEADFRGATLTHCNVYGISAWGLNVSDTTKQKDLIITPPGEHVIIVDNLEVAQFIYLLLHNEKIRDVVDTVAKKMVLILGRFTDTRKLALIAIKDKLRDLGYLPVLFDFKGPTTRNTLETITLLARLARFIIADITCPKSITQELTSIVPALPSVPIKPIIQAGVEPWGMYDSITVFPWVLELYYYQDVNELLASFEEKIIAPAEEKVKERNWGKIT